MTCFLTNGCKNKSSCCNFCKAKRCSDRCADDYTKCRYFQNVLFGEVNNGSNTSKKSKR